MTEINYSTLLREVVADYFERRLTRVEYLAQRRGILDRIDHEFNGEDRSNGWPEPDITQPVEHGASSQTSDSNSNYSCGADSGGGSTFE